MAESDHDTDAITEFDIDAYLDEQLDLERRIVVQGYLARTPEAAKRVMADLEIRDALRLAATREAACAGPGAARHGGASADMLAGRLQRAHTRARWSRRLRPAAVAMVMLTAGWTGHAGYAAWQGQGATPALHAHPSVVDDAVRAHRTAVARAAMVSQPDVPVLDTDEILRSLGIQMPALPADWLIRDVQVFPASNGPGVEVTLDVVPDAGPDWALEAVPARMVSVFAARAPQPGAAAALEQGRSRADDTSVVYWRKGQWVYALAGNLPEPELSVMAQRLAPAVPAVH